VHLDCDYLVVSCCTVRQVVPRHRLLELLQRVAMSTSWLSVELSCTLHTSENQRRKLQRFTVLTRLPTIITEYGIPGMLGNL